MYPCLNTQPVGTQQHTAASTSVAVVAPVTPRRVLIFSKTKGWKYTLIRFGIAAI